MDKLQFQIDQLRKDKIIYATEAVATSTTAIVIILIMGKSNLTYCVGIFAVLYWVYAMLTNFFRLRKIRQLESQL